MPSTVQLDTCGRRRSPATLSSFHQGRPSRNKGQRYPADPPTVEEIIAVMHAAGDGHDAVRLRALIIVLWRAGLRISEALALSESDLDLHRGAILVRPAKAVSAARSGMDRFSWEQLGARAASMAARRAHGIGDAAPGGDPRGTSRATCSPLADEVEAHGLGLAGGRFSDLLLPAITSA